jgi:8-oxo-dGTP pyrophosphatase MutT (NUDIX family)
MKKWKTLESHTLFQSGYAQFRREVCEVEKGRIMSNYYILDVRDWVNVVALTPEGKVLLVRQYRHAAKIVTTEIPGGAIDASDASPEAAGRRELLEETGFSSGETLFAAQHFPNPALQSNRLWTFVFADCVRVAEPDWDEFEEMEIDLVSWGELKAMIVAGQLTHSLILASLLLGWSTVEQKLSLPQSGS